MTFYRWPWPDRCVCPVCGQVVHQARQAAHLTTGLNAARRHGTGRRGTSPYRAQGHNPSWSPWFADVDEPYGYPHEARQCYVCGLLEVRSLWPLPRLTRRDVTDLELPELPQSPPIVLAERTPPGGGQRGTRSSDQD